MAENSSESIINVSMGLEMGAQMRYGCDQNQSSVIMLFWVLYVGDPIRFMNELEIGSQLYGLDGKIWAIEIKREKI